MLYEVITYAGCNTNITRTYTITEYQDDNSNGIRDVGENTVLNTTSCNQTILINDTTAPAIDVTANDMTVECDGNGNTTQLQNWLAVNGGASSSDDCSNVSWSNDYAALSTQCGATGSVLVTFTATDDCGNSATTSATFTIQDTTAPTFSSTLPSNITVECDEVPIAETISATDNCSATATVTLNEEVISNGDCAGEYTLIRTWTATDDCGNETSYSQTITRNNFV